MIRFKGASPGLLLPCCVVAFAAAAQQLAPPEVKAYNIHCASCHGDDLKGGSGPSILSFVRYHTNAEVMSIVRDNSVHTTLALPDEDLRKVLAGLRVLAGTNPAMATGGFTGYRPKAIWTQTARAIASPEPSSGIAARPMTQLPDSPGKQTFVQVCTGCHSANIVLGKGNTRDGWTQLVSSMVERGAKGSADQLATIVQYLTNNFPPSTNVSVNSASISVLKHIASWGVASFENFQPRPATLILSDGQTLRGTLMGQTESDAQLLTADGKFHLLQRDRGIYRDKPIEPKSDWLSYHGSPTGNRYSPLEQINAGNIQRLKAKWGFRIPASPRLQATPAVVDGVMYMTGWNELYAIDATTGHQIWSYHQPRTEGILSEAGRGANRGVAISGDRVFMVTDSAHLLAFDRRTGTKLWDVKMGSIKNGYSATAAPLVAGDVVVSGIAGGEEGARGFIDAYKVTTGEHAWRFYTIPKRGDKEAQTWIGQALEHGCGTTWLTGSYDPALDLVYWGTGNPCPDFNGSERRGDNLYTSSVVAVSAETGQLKWYFQFTPHDTHDWDSAQSMVLVDEQWQGRARKLLVHGDRNGYFFVLDRTNGKLLLAKPLSTKVTWTTGYAEDGHPVLTSNAETSPTGTVVCPNGSGGANWPDPSYSPITKLFYVRVSDSCGLYAAGDDPLLAASNRWYGGGVPSASARELFAKLEAVYPNRTFIRAVDIFTGNKIWDYPTGSSRTGVLSTAGGLVFMGGGGGLLALDANTGKPLWSVDVNQQGSSPVPGTFSATPMTYMVGGKQYIALPGTGVVFAYALTN